MPTNTYTALATITLTGDDSTIDFTNIPSTYKDLRIVMFSKINNTITFDGSVFRINGDAGSNYSMVDMRGTGSSAASGSTTRNVGNIGGDQTTDFSINILDFLDYSATDKHKSWLIRINSSEFARAWAGRWASTTAINRITLYGPDFTGGTQDSWVSGSTFSLYGIAG